MEGKFNRDKNSLHPHTNMAKAALNMMTNTCGKEFTKDNIYMTSVDTGWISNEYPTEIAEKIYARSNFIPPLDEIDGASRILDPIFSKSKLYGVFLKDYSISNW
jgi:NAD(P)-dependent dehydrogenase (short-subunit alcohol dehydrogenase family)